MNAVELLDSRSFRNKLDYFVSVAARKRPKPSDAEVAEAFQPVLDALGKSGPVAVAPTLPPVEPLRDDEKIVAAPVENIISRMDRIIGELAPVVANLPMDAKGIRWLNVAEDIPVSELTGYLQDKTDAPFFIDPTEMTMMNINHGGWVLPCRTR